MRRLLAGAVALAMALGALASAQEVTPPPLEHRVRTDRVMSSDLTIDLYGPDAAVLDSTLDACFAEFRRIEDELTDWRPSPLTRLNDAAGRGPQPVPPDLLEVADTALVWARETGGAFDPTFAAVGALWDFKRRPPLVPDAAAIHSALERVGHAKVRLDREAGTIELPAGMRLGLNGLTQGWAVDQAMAIILRAGIKDALVNHSGDIKALGRKDGRPWQIAVKHPRDKERAIAVVPISNACLTTSGDYEHCFELDGVRYHHIIDCRTGYPSKGCMSATVVGPRAVDCDALDTALCVLSPAEGLALIERLPRFECVLVDMEGKVHLSSGLRGRAPAERQERPGQ